MNTFFFRPVLKKLVLKKVLSSLSLAKREIFATMDLDEEMEKPLSQVYIQRLEKVIERGVKVYRHVYGKKKYFLEVKERYSNVETKYMGEANLYQRMIIIDDFVAFFKIEHAFFYTEFKPLIRSLKIYADFV